jgi:hypothetical protein
MSNENLNIKINVKDNATRIVQGIQSRFRSFKDRMSAGWVSLAAKVYLFQKGLKVLQNVFGSLVAAAQEQEDSTKRLNVALGLQGSLTDEVSKKFQDYAKELQRSTRFGDEAIQDAMQTLIAVGNVTTDEMPRATQAVIDFATATGRDLKTSSLTVAKAAAGFTAELSRYGIIIDANIPKAQKVRTDFAVY